MRTTGGDALALCARADERFHELTYRTHGIALRRRPALWWVTEATSPVLIDAATRTPAARVADVAGALGGLRRAVTVRDTFARLDLAPHGFAPDEPEPWMVREPGSLAVDPVPGLVVARATTPAAVLAFERTTVVGGGGLPGHVDGAIHPAAATAATADLHAFVGRIDGEPVATALAAVAPDALSIGAVTTLPAWRRRGIGAAVTAAAVAAAPDRPATLTATPLGEPVYRRLGFRTVGTSATWHRPAR